MSEQQLDPATVREEVLAAALREEWPRPRVAHLVVVLSAPPSLHETEDEWEREANEENKRRIELGAAIAEEFDVPLCLSGDDLQLPFMKTLAAHAGASPDLFVPVSAGPRATANTKTQFQKLAGFVDMGFEKLVLVTTSYHVPRVERTAQAQLPYGALFRVVAVPRSVFHFDLERMVEGEVRRILAYAGRDIAFKVPAERFLPI